MTSETNCLTEEFHNIMRAHHNGQYKTTSEVTTLIKETIFNHIDKSSKAVELFEFANSQMLQLNLIDSDEAELFPSKIKKQVEKKLSPAESQRTTSKRVSQSKSKSLRQATLSSSGQVVMPASTTIPKLTEEQALFVREWIVKLTPFQQAGVAKIVVESGAGKTGENGSFEFEMEDLSTGVCLTIFNFVEKHVKVIKDSEKKIQRY